MNLPTGPIEADPIDAYRGRSLAEVRALLDGALTGVELGTYDQSMIEWLKTALDQPTLVTIASLIIRARKAGPVS